MNKLNPHSFLASFYRYFYLKSELPKSLCDYVWGLFFAFICLPFVWPVLVINRWSKTISYHERTASWYDEHTYGIKEGDLLKKYDVGYNPLSTGYGFIFNFGIVIIGFFTYYFFFYNTNMHDIIPYAEIGKTSVNFTSLWVIQYLYLLGIGAILLMIGFFYWIVFIITIVNKFKKEPTSEERIAKYEAEQKRNREKSLKQLDKIEYRKANPSFLTLLWRRIIAFKENNCPIIEWDYNITKKK